MLARFTRLTTATILALLALAAVGGSASATPTCGSKLCLETTHSPATAFVTQNSLVTYRVEVTNPGTSTATKVILRFALDSRTTLVSTVPSGCSVASNAITCTLGSVKPTGGTPRVFEFSVRMPAAATVTAATASISSDARGSDSGNDPNDPTLERFSDAPEVVDVRTIDGRAISAVPNGLSLTLDTDVDGLAATKNDTRTAKFALLASGFSTTADINDQVEDTSFVCPPDLRCPGGGWTEAVIPGPLGLRDPFAPPSKMELVLRYDASTIPPGLTTAKYVLLHDLDYNDPDTGLLERISRPCSSNPAPCLKSVDKLRDGDFLVVALVTGNWRYR